jgi:hypothetical protein
VWKRLNLVGEAYAKLFFLHEKGRQLLGAICIKTICSKKTRSLFIKRVGQKAVIPFNWFISSTLFTSIANYDDLPPTESDKYIKSQNCAKTFRRNINQNCAKHCAIIILQYSKVAKTQMSKLLHFVAFTSNCHLLQLLAVRDICTIFHQSGNTKVLSRCHCVTHVSFRNFIYPICISLLFFSWRFEST